MLVRRFVAPGLARVKFSEFIDEIRIAVEELDDHVLVVAAHADENEDLHRTPKARGVSRASENEELAATGEEDWQACKRLRDVGLIDACLYTSERAGKFHVQIKEKPASAGVRGRLGPFCGCVSTLSSQMCFVLSSLPAHS